MKFSPEKAIATSIFLWCLVLLAAGGAASTAAADKPYQHLVILGDPHLPGKYLSAKEQVIQTINSWNDADMVVAVGDLCEDRGTQEEYAAVKRFFAGLQKPLYPVAGNHDYIYEDSPGPGGKRIRGGSDSREAKLGRFRATFGQEETYYSRKAGNYLLVFLAVESPEHLAVESPEHLAQMTERQLEWLRSELQKERRSPAIIFFHAPLQGTLQNYNSHVNTANYVAQPAAAIHDILAGNPQVFLWVSGHTHTSPREGSYASAINVYDTRVTNIHNTDMNRATIWTNSLFLYPDKVVVKTYDHKSSAWMPEFERTIARPGL